MAEARLRIRVEGGRDVARAMGDIAGMTRRTGAAQNNEERTTSRDRTAILREEMRQAGMMERLRESERLRSLRAATTAVERAARERQRAEQAAANATNREEQNRTRVAEQEARKRERAAQQAAQEEERSQERITRAHEREIQRRGRAAERALAAARRSGREAGTTVGGFGVQAAGTVHSMLQDARQSRASTEHTLNLALYQAGAGGGSPTGLQDAARLRENVYAFARQNRMSSADIASGINAAQTEFSTLGNSQSSQGEREANLQGMLQTALLARNMGQDVGQTMRVQAMLQNAGITGTANRTALLGLTGMAQRGAIELGSVTREAMMPMQNRMAQARSDLLQRNPAATEEEQAATQQHAALQSFAEIEVARGLGASPRRFARVMAQMGPELQSSHRQQMIHTNIVNSHDISAEQRTALLAMFDQHGHLQQQFQNGLGFAGGVNDALHGDVSAMRNVFTGGGHGNPMSLQTNWRDAMAQMMGGNEEVRRMMAGVGVHFTETDVNRGAELFRNEQQSHLQENEENRLSALTDNTSAMNQMSDQLARFQAQNPLIATLGATIAGGVATRLAASIGGSLAANFTALRAGGFGVAAAGGGAAGSVLAPVAAGLAGVGLTTYIGNLIQDMRPGSSGLGRGRHFDISTGLSDIQRMLTGPADQTGRTAPSSNQELVAQLRTTAASSTGGEAMTALLNQLATAVERGMSRATVTATVSPADAAHATTVATTNATTNPPPVTRN